MFVRALVIDGRKNGELWLSYREAEMINKFSH